MICRNVILSAGPLSSSSPPGPRKARTRLAVVNCRRILARYGRGSPVDLAASRTVNRFPRGCCERKSAARMASAEARPQRLMASLPNARPVLLLFPWQAFLHPRCRFVGGKRCRPDGPFLQAPGSNSVLRGLAWSSRIFARILPAGSSDVGAPVHPAGKRFDSSDVRRQFSESREELTADVAWFRRCPVSRIKSRNGACCRCECSEREPAVEIPSEFRTAERVEEPAGQMAERVGFEPTSPVLPGYPLSRRALSTAQTPLRVKQVHAGTTCRAPPRPSRTGKKSLAEATRADKPPRYDRCAGATSSFSSPKNLCALCASVANFQRRAVKKPCSSAAHSSASTPLVTSTRWLSCGWSAT